MNKKHEIADIFRGKRLVSVFVVVCCMSLGERVSQAREKKGECFSLVDDSSKSE